MKQYIKRVTRVSNINEMLINKRSNALFKDKMLYRDLIILSLKIIAFAVLQGHVEIPLC